ncbi:transposase, partial [Candidatus Poribacteria bacterium]|nr:transposase [Candidatus Poribacteria bacterium]
YYQQRWLIETAFRDAKQHFGFSGYHVKSRKSINRFVQLSFIAASLTKLIFSLPHPTEKPINVKTVCEFLGIHWYHPKKLTQGLRVAYLQAQIRELGFSTSSTENTNSQNMQTFQQQEPPLPFDKAA